LDNVDIIGTKTRTSPAPRDGGEDLMGTRRDFLQLGVAASALPFAEKALGSRLLQTSAVFPVMPLYKVVFDERIPASVAFARRMQELGAVVRGIRGDITDFWFHDLHATWTNEPIAIAGLTAHGPLFCLERLAWDHRMRVLYRAEHRVRPDGRIEHAVSGPDDMVKAAADLAGGARDWSVHVANIVSRCPRECSTRADATIVSSVSHSLGGGESVHDEESLMSWVIGPQPRA
jgi:hypothetical protein